MNNRAGQAVVVNVFNHATLSGDRKGTIMRNEHFNMRTAFIDDETGVKIIIGTECEIVEVCGDDTLS